MARNPSARPARRTRTSNHFVQRLTSAEPQCIVCGIKTGLEPVLVKEPLSVLSCKEHKGLVALVAASGLDVFSFLKPKLASWFERYRR